MTTFVDYIFKISSDGSIIWDEELTPEKLGVQEGDRFEVVFIPGSIVFRKVVKGPAPTGEAGP